MLTNLKPKDLVAVVALIVIVVLKLNGFDGALDSLIALIVGYYFGHRQNGIDTGV